MNNVFADAWIKLMLIRKRNGFTQKVIAAFLGVDKKLLADFEKGKNTLSVGEVEKLAILYGLDIFSAQGSVNEIRIIKLPFNANKITKEELEGIYAINKIAINSNFMAKLLEINGT